MKKIELHNITKTFGSVIAVDKLHLEIEEGEFLTLLGPSGCGKTTTLRMIAGLEDPTDGEIITHERVLYAKDKGVYVPPEDRGMGFMFQSYALWPHMNVTKNISLGLETKKLPKKEIEERLKRVLQQVQMSGYEDRYPSELSGGQQQRIALARMIASEANVFLMDEPLSNLDALLRIDMRSELKHLHQTLGATTVYVTHDQMEALTLSDRIVVMHKGKIMQLGTPAQIYHTPANLFVAKFVGNPPINLIRGVINRKNDSSVVLDGGDFELDVTKSPKAEILQAGAEIVMGIRPENLSISSELANKDGISCIVYSVLPTGSETIITARKGNSEFRIKTSGFSEFQTDQEITILCNPRSMLFFHAETEYLIS